MGGGGKPLNVTLFVDVLWYVERVSKSFISNSFLFHKSILGKFKQTTFVM